MNSTLDYDVRDMAQSAVQANKDHQYALKVYTERLEAELETVEKLLATAEISEHEDELEVNAGGIVVVPGSVKPAGLLTPGDLLAEHSPFWDDAMRRQRYIESTVIHPMKPSELEALADGVRSENYRIHAIEAQSRGQQPFVSVDDYPSGHFELNKVGIDWERVATKVFSSGSSNVQHSAKECEIRWLGERHPQFNHTQWTQSEITRVKELVAGAKEGQVDWADIATKLGTRRTPVDCMRHAIPRRTHLWTPEADDRLLEAVRIYGVDSWTLVARLVSEDCTPTQCQSRYTRSLDPSIKRGAWTAEEDDQLRRAVTVLGHSWIEVATYIPGRTNEQCRDRYQDYLNPSISRGKWTEDQDKALLQAVEQAGELKWKEISKVFANGRTDSQCRTRYGVLMKRRTKCGTNSPTPSSSGLPASAEQSTSGAPQSPAGPAPPSRLASTSAPPDPGTSTVGVEAQIARPRPKPRPRRKKAGEHILAGATPTASESAGATPTDVPHGAVVTAGTGNSVEAMTEEGSSQGSRKATRKPAKRRPTAQEGEGSQPPKSKRARTGKAPEDDPSSEQNGSEPPPAADTGVGDAIAEEAPEQNAIAPRKARAKLSPRKPKYNSRKQAQAGKALQLSLPDIRETPENSTSVDLETAAAGAVPQKGRRGKKAASASCAEPTRRQPSRNASRNAATQKIPMARPATSHPVSTTALQNEAASASNDAVPTVSATEDGHPDDERQHLSDVSSLPESPV